MTSLQKQNHNKCLDAYLSFKFEKLPELFMKISSLYYSLVLGLCENYSNVVKISDILIYYSALLCQLKTILPYKSQRFKNWQIN